MSNKPTEPDSLRTEAEAQLSRVPPTETPAHSAEALLHELRVHQIELEMQNEALRQSQTTLEESRDRYVSLYEFAPVGYLTLTRAGQISEINLTGATLLGAERKKLLRQRFDHFISPEDRDRWHLMLIGLMESPEKAGIELTLQRSDGSALHVHLDCLRRQFADAAPEVHMALTDISAMQLNKQLRDLSAHLQTVREEEKAHLAREIHDDLGGTLAVLKMDAYWLMQKLAADNKMAFLLKQAESMYELLDDAIKAMRRIGTGLRPPILDDLGLLAALEWQCAQFQKRTGIECNVQASTNESCAGEPERIMAINLFRIFQETLTNVARHSGATKVEASFQHGKKALVMSISDNGCGLPQENGIASTSYGIHGMRERVEQMGGKIKFDVPPSGGLSVTVILPLPAGSKSDE